MEHFLIHRRINKVKTLSPVSILTLFFSAYLIFIVMTFIQKCDPLIGIQTKITRKEHCFRCLGDIAFLKKLDLHVC